MTRRCLSVHGHLSWPHIARYCDTIAAIPHIARYFFRGLSTSPKWCDTPPPLVLSFTQAHLCDFATYRAIIVRYPIKASTKEFCDTIAASIARYEKYRYWASNLAHRNRSDFCDLRLRCPSRTPEIARFPRQEKAMLHCDLRVRWKVASDLRFRAAISEPKTPSFCGISGDLAPSTRKSLAIAIVRFWCAKCS